MRAFQILDSNDVVLEDNVTEEVVTTLMGDDNGSEFNYFFYPLDAEIKSSLVSDDTLNKIRFIKEILETEE
jgi:hypothetical protein